MFYFETFRIILNPSSVKKVKQHLAMSAIQNHKALWRKKRQCCNVKDVKRKPKTAIIMAHPVVVDDELCASPFFLRSLWLTMNNQNSERHAVCCDRPQVFPMTVERCGSPPCHAWWRLCSEVWVCQFYEARYRTRCRGYPWAGDHLPYGWRGLASADVAALW